MTALIDTVTFVRNNVLSSIGSVLAGAVATLLGWYILSYYTSPLLKYPGPFLAGFTNLWRLHLVWTQKYQWKIKELHEKYGPVVRIGPNLLDLDIPDLIKTLYGTDGKWKKACAKNALADYNIALDTKFYHNSSAYVNGKINYHLFSTTDQAAHSRLKRPVVKYYSMSSILTLEPHVDDVVTDLCRHLEDRFIKKGEECDFGRWIAYYAWDLISSMTFSQRFDYMEKGYDYDKTIEIADKVTDYFAMVGQIPILDFFLDKNPIIKVPLPSLGNVTRIAVENLVKRIKSSGEKTEMDQRHPDFLDRFLDTKSTHPDIVDDGVIIGYLQVNLVAGADTSAITFRAIFHFLLTNPHTMDKLVAEILTLGPDRDTPVSYTAARALPYLDAVIRESMRMYPGVGMLLERYVPASGLTLPDGSHLPPGVCVGINPYVMGRNKEVWGDDSNTFRPERWLKSDGEEEDTFQQRLRDMNAADLTFGGGSRICIGRHLALLEIYKVVPTLLRRYEVEMVDPKSFKMISSWFPRQSGLVCRLKMRP